MMKKVLIGCGIFVLIGFILFVAIIVWMMSLPEGGVRFSNDMEKYAQTYLEENKVLNSSEELVAYYDVTFPYDSTEAAILTNKRVIYHKNGKNDFINLEDIENITYEDEGLVGDTFVIISSDGKTIKIEIAPLNGGASWKTVLMKAWEKAKEKKKAEK